MALTVLGPAFIVAKARMPEADAAILAWQVGMATMVLMGVFKLVMSFYRRSCSTRDSRSGTAWFDRRRGHRACSARCNSAEIYGEPIVGMMALGVIFYALVAKIKLPVPRARGAGERRDRRHALLRARGAGVVVASLSRRRRRIFRSGLPLPSLGFLKGMPIAVRDYLPLALPVRDPDA